jgi:SAM-dependent methyltransferase
MGQYSSPLAVKFADLSGVRHGQRALDVGCGPGALTDVLVERLGLDSVAAIDPSPPFVAALRTRYPGLDVRSGTAEELPFPDDGFDLALAELVVHFMSDPVSGLREMARVTRDDGLVGACVWDHAPGGGGPLTTFWQAVRDLDPAAVDESELPGSREGHLTELCETAGLQRVEATSLTVTVQFSTFADWWDPYLLGVGPAGAYVARLDETHRDALSARCAELLPAAPFEVAASAWCVTARP